MVTLSKEQAVALLAFLNAFDETTTGAWAQIEEYMKENGGVDDPEEAMEEIRNELQKHV